MKIKDHKELVEALKKIHNSGRGLCRDQIDRLLDYALERTLMCEKYKKKLAEKLEVSGPNRPGHIEDAVRYRPGYENYDKKYFWDALDGMDQGESVMYIQGGKQFIIYRNDPQSKIDVKIKTTIHDPDPVDEEDALSDDDKK